MTSYGGQSESDPEPEVIKYTAPEYYGEFGATESMTSVAAPLLAGGGIALAGVVVQQQSSVRFPGVVLLMLVATVVALVASVQAGFWARQHAALPADIEQWHRHLPVEQRNSLIAREQADDYASYVLWSTRARWSFGVGIVLLWCGLGTAILPQEADKEIVIRWIAAGLAYVSACLECIWILIAMFFRDRFRKLLLGRR